MSELLADFRSEHDRISIPTIWVAFALSVLLHAALMWPWLPELSLISLSPPKDDPSGGRLQVLLVPRAAPKPTPPPAPPPAPAVRPQPPVVAKAAPQPKAAPPPKPKPPVLATERPSAEKAPAPKSLPKPAEPEPAPSAAAGDLSSYIAAQRRARAQASASPPSPAVPRRPSERDRFDQIVASNLGLDRAPTYGENKVGGIFEIRRMGYDSAEFVFFGWNKDIERNTEQLIEVRQGNNSSIQIAVVRRMIAIIRENADEDFVWVSPRLGRDVTLSARPQDNAGLEAFLMQEFFGDPRRRY